MYLTIAGQSISRQQGKAKGSILIISLWAVSLLSMFSVALAYGVRQEAALVKRLDEKARLSLILRAGYEQAFLEFRNIAQGNAWDSLKDLWNNNPSVFKGVRIGDGELDFAYEYINVTRDGTSLETHYGIVDENRKININKADNETLERLFKAVLGFGETDSQQLAACIIDWRDGDNMLSIPLGSAEGAYYRDLVYPYEAKDSDIEALEELLLVKGMAPEILEKLSPYITIYTDGKVNINTASRHVLSALGLNDDMADKIISFRMGEDKKAGTEDDNVFENTVDITESMKEFYKLSEADVAELAGVSGSNITTVSESFTVRCSAHLDGKKYTARLACVMDRQGNILRWQEM